MQFSREKATEVFIKNLILHSYNGVIETTLSNLENGPPGRMPPRNRVAWHEWYIALDETGKNNIREIIRDTVDATLFSALVLLDGASGYPIKDKLSDFALYLQVYENEKAAKDDIPINRIKLNPWSTTEDLHDIFHWMLDDIKKNEAEK